MTLIYISSLDKYIDSFGELWTDNELDMFDKLEREWKKEQPYYSLYDMLQEFPEGEPIVRKKVKRLKELRNEHYQWFQEKVIPSCDFRIHGALIEWNDKNLEDYNKTISELESALRKRGKDFDIARAKQVPIESFLPVPRTNKVHCLFHDDPNASMHIYRKDNRYHCFGCGASGTVIDIVMKLRNLSFVEAVKLLTQ